MDVSAEERVVLNILYKQNDKVTHFTLERIEEQQSWEKQGKDQQTLLKVLEGLMRKDLVTDVGSTYTLTKNGIDQVKRWMSEGFSARLVASDQSEASARFCEQVYGINLCQLNMMGQDQLENLLAIMNLTPNDRLLDLGCGIGRVSEYICDRTGANVLGIDFAAGAIERAQERTRDKQEWLSYRVMDMDDLDLPAKSFSAVIAIDTLYFVRDLAGTIQTVRESLAENGQMGFFFSTLLSEGENASNLAPDQTKLAKALSTSGLDFRTWEFTQDEQQLWEKMLPAAEALKETYEAEGNLSIYQGTVDEAEEVLQVIRSGRHSRYFYHVR